VGTSAFEILVVPVLWATVGLILAGALIRGLINAFAAVIGRLRRSPRSHDTIPGAVASSHGRAPRPLARGVASIG